MGEKQPRVLPERAVLIRSPFVEQILDGGKTWELPGSATKIRGRIGLIRSTSGLVVGSCELVDVVGPLSLTELRRHACKAGARPSEFASLPYQHTFAWVLRDAKPFRPPVPYRHPSGAIIWVRLTPRARQ